MPGDPAGSNAKTCHETMQLTFHVERDGITPSLRERLARARNARGALAAAGESVVSMTQRAFTNPSLRPAGWDGLAARTLAGRAKRGRKGTRPLLDSTLLQKSIRVVGADNASVTVGSDRRAGSYSLAAIHQYGAPRRKIPARPFFPIRPDGSLTPLARRRFAAALRAALRLG